MSTPRHKDVDIWFDSHYTWAAGVIVDTLNRAAPLAGTRVLDLGCGDGIMSLGVRHAGACHVVGVDVTEAFRNLPRQAEQAIGLTALPDHLEFVRVGAGQHLPFQAACFDAVYAWSVFEHVHDVPELLAEVVGVLRPGGHFFLQIEPLFFSAYGSHLRRLIDVPWAHLQDEDLFLTTASEAEDKVRDEERDVVYQLHDFAAVRQYLLSEYHSLNRITTAQLLDSIERTGFEILEHWENQLTDLALPEGLTDRYEEHDLRTNEVRLLLRKPR